MIYNTKEKENIIESHRDRLDEIIIALTLNLEDYYNTTDPEDIGALKVIYQFLDSELPEKYQSGKYKKKATAEILSSAVAGVPSIDGEQK